MMRYLCVTLLALLLSSCAKHWTGNAQDFAYIDLTTGEVSKLSKLAGKPVVLNFWADWWGPCKAEFPHFQEIYTEKKGQFELVSIAAPSSNDAAGFVSVNHYGWIFGQGIAKLPSGAKAIDPTEIYHVEGLPTTVFIDRTGQIVDTVFGGMEKTDFEEKLAKIL